MIIYRAYITGRSENGVEPCYIGKTIQTLEEREQQHWRDAEKSKNEERGKAGKLHRIMWAEGRASGKIKFEEIDRAMSVQELAHKEREYVLKYDSKDKGWNTVVPSGEVLAPCELSNISVLGQNISFNGYKDLARKLSNAFNVNVSYSTLLLNLQDLLDNNKEQELESACDAAIATAKQTVFKRRTRIVFGTEVGGKDWFNQIVSDKTLNRNKLTKNQLRRLLNGKDDEKSIEAALLQKPSRVPKSYTLLSPDNQTFGPCQSIPALLKELALAFPTREFPRDTSVRTNLERGYSLAQAVGLEDPPWATTSIWRLVHRCVDNGYQLIGEKRHESEPVISHNWKIVFSSKKNCALHFNLDYTTLCEQLQEKELDEYLETKNKLRSG